MIASNGSASYGIWLFKKLESSYGYAGIFGSSHCQERFPYTNQQLLQMGVIVRLISHCNDSMTTFYLFIYLFKSLFTVGIDDSQSCQNHTIKEL